jgi:hypothetical protein
MSNSIGANDAPAVKTVGPLLAVGILGMPFVFAWFLVRQGYSQRARFVAFSWLGIIAIALLRQGLPGDTPDSTATNPTAASATAGGDGPDRYADAAFVDHYVKGFLRDPQSARFSEVYAYRAGKQLSYCGNVNAKNGMGGYTGPQAFIASDSGFYLGEQATPARTAEYCKGSTRTEVPL